jgi:prophage regulatory protein
VKRGRKIARKSEPAARRIIRRPEVKRRTGYSGTTIWRKEKEGTFPKHVQLSPDGMAVGWYEDEVDDWIRSRVREPGKRPPAAKRARPEEQDVGSKTVNAAHTGAVEPAKKTTKRAGAREASTSTRPTTPARGIVAAAAPKRGRDARSGHRAE